MTRQTADDIRSTICSAKADEIITPEHVTEMLDMEGIDSLGFDAVEQRNFQLLKEHQGAMRLNTFSSTSARTMLRSLVSRNRRRPITASC